jgi:D-lactate dehydrogenase
MCQTSCPVKIDTGALMKELKAAAQPAWARQAARLAARRGGAVLALGRGGLRTAGLLARLPGGARALAALSAGAHRAAPGLIPRLTPEHPLPQPASALPQPRRIASQRHVAYFPSCLTRLLGPQPGEAAAPDAAALLDLLQAGGWSVVYPEGVGGLCCGMPFASRALPDAARDAADRALDALRRSGAPLVVTDASPCAATLREAALSGDGGAPAPQVLDFPAFWAAHGLAALPPRRLRPGTAVLHPTCTLVKAGGLADLLRVAQACAEKVTVPAGAECCGFGGDRGFLIPELTERAAWREASEAAWLADASAGFYSTCRTCEIGMTRAVGRPYRSLIHLVHEATLGCSTA